MQILSNLFFIFLIIGIISRVLDWLLFKYSSLEKKVSIYVAMIITILITAPLVAIFVGFDVLISSYLLAILLWLLIDLVRIKS